MSILMVIALVLFILCNAICLAAIVAASRTDRSQIKPRRNEQIGNMVDDNAREHSDMPVKAKFLVRKTG